MPRQSNMVQDIAPPYAEPGTVSWIMYMKYTGMTVEQMKEQAASRGCKENPAPDWFLRQLQRLRTSRSSDEKVR